jgi:hypothetical protein
MRKYLLHILYMHGLILIPLTAPKISSPKIRMWLSAINYLFISVITCLG